MTVEFASVECRVPAVDLERARRRYADKLGLQPKEERPGGSPTAGIGAVLPES